MERTGNFSFNLPVVDRAIVEALRHALENVMPDIMIDNNFLNGMVMVNSVGM